MTRAVERLRILYVEDDPADQALTRRALGKSALNVELTVIGTVQGAVDRLEQGGVDLVLSDYRLPDGTGLDVLETVRAREWAVPVVLVTGSGDVEAAVRLLKAGAADYVVKRSGYLDTLAAVLDGAYRWFWAAEEVRRMPISVLYAEHDAEDALLMRRAFAAHGRHLALEVVSRGRDALERLRAVSYDLLLLDHRLPDLTGIEVLKKLREERAHVPVVMVTGQGDEETAVQAFKLGAADYVVKAGGYLSKLPDTVEHVLAQHRLVEEREALVVLNSVPRMLAAVREIDELARRVAKAATELLHADGAVLWLVDGTELRPVGLDGLDQAALSEARLRLDLSRVERVGTSRRLGLPRLLPADAAPGDGALFLLEQGGPPLACALESGGQLLGVLAVASRRAREFRAAEERLLVVLADHAAVAIENAELYGRLQSQLEELGRAQAQLLQTEKIAAMGQLLAGVAHELNNPLAVVMGRADLLAKQLGGGPLGASADKLTAAAERCARIVKNFLALARQHPPARSLVHLNSVVGEALELLAYPLRTDGVELTLDLASDLPPLWADPHQLHQVLVNLVTNAHQAMRETPPPRRLTITSAIDRPRERVVLRVADSGPGIPADMRTRIFEPFFTTKPPGQGTGLGLSLCQSIIEGHEGSIWVEPGVGGGAQFVVELPVGVRGETGGPDEPSGSEPAIRDKRILVVDDEPEIGVVLEQILSTDGHSVDWASNGLAALERLSERAYDLIVSDLRMPEMDGPTLYTEVQRRYPALGARFVFLTGDALGPVMEFVAQTGAPTLGKPFAAGDVRRIVQRTFGGS